MRHFFAFIISCLFALTASAQIDNKNKSRSIPAVESKKDSAEAKKLLPSKPLNNNTINGISIPKTNTTTLNFPKKEFSMFGEKFGNPGELYDNRFKKIEKKLKPEGYGSNGGLKEHTYWGDYRTKSEYIDIALRDYGEIDGDLLQVSVDDEIVQPRIFLSERYKGFRVKLKEGFNKIEFLALNEGSLLPNTADYKVIDQWKNIITGKIWALSSNVKVTLIIVKE